MNVVIGIVVKVAILVLRGLLPWVPIAAWEALEAWLHHLYSTEYRHAEANLFHAKVQECIGESCFIPPEEVEKQDLL